MSASEESLSLGDSDSLQTRHRFRLNFFSDSTSVQTQLLFKLTLCSDSDRLCSNSSSAGIAPNRIGSVSPRIFWIGSIILHCILIQIGIENIYEAQSQVHMQKRGKGRVLPIFSHGIHFRDLYGFSDAINWDTVRLHVNWEFLKI